MNVRRIVRMVLFVLELPFAIFALALAVAPIGVTLLLAAIWMIVVVSK